MATVGTLTFDLVANSAKLVKDLGKAQKNIKTFSADARKNVNKVGKAFVAASAASSAALLAISVAAAKNTREMVNSARVANENLQTFTALSMAAKDYGIEQEKLADILKDTQDRIGDFLITGGGPMLDFFETIAPKIGVTAEQFKGLSGSEALQLYHDSLKRANVSQEEMVFFMEAMASDATQLIPILNQGADGLAEYADKAEILGLNLSDIDAAQIELMNQHLGTGAEALQGLGQQIALQLSPFVQELSNEFLNVAREAGGMGEVVSRAVGVGVSVVGVFADAVRALQIAWTGVKLAVTGVVGGIVLGLVEADKAVTAFLNSLPGVNAQASEMLTELHAGLAETYDEINQELDEKLMAPLPSESIKQFVSDVQSKSKAAAKELVDQNGTIGEILMGSGAGAGENLGDASPTQSWLDSLATFDGTMKRYGEIAANTGAVIEDALVTSGGRAISSMSDGLANAVVHGEDLNKTFRDVGKTLAVDVLSSMVEMGAQILINKAIGSAATAAGVCEAAVAGPAIAAAYAPAAATTSLATLGGNSIPAIAGIGAAMAAVAGIVGQAHDGHDALPSDGTWNLQKGERVIPSDQNERITRALENGASNGQGAANITVNNVYNIAPNNDASAIRAELARVTPIIEQRSVNAVRKALREGGSMSRAAGVR